jgi:NAD-dependent DNA ligase
MVLMDVSPNGAKHIRDTSDIPTICPMCGKKSAKGAKEYRVQYCAGTCSKQADTELEAYLPKKV